jgi:predicted glycosyltransferase involved in capsule biosynthesis
MVSFVFYACDKRLDNLYQTIRILNKNEIFLNKEIIVVYQDSGPEIENTKCFNLNLSSYQKAVMCNFGVRQSKNNIIALLDSDRILPVNYFSLNWKLNEKEMLTTSLIHNLERPCTDEQIKNKDYEFRIEERSKQYAISMKNLFSGNTLFNKNDYFYLGGMDEKFIGYGYTDTDITRQAITKGIKTKFLNVPEVHLWHNKSVLYKNQELYDFEIQSVINLMLYSIKWSDYDPMVHKLCNNVIKKIDNYPKDLVKEFFSIYKKIYLC